MVETHGQVALAPHGQSGDDRLGLEAVLPHGCHMAAERLGEPRGNRVQGIRRGVAGGLPRISFGDVEQEVAQVGLEVGELGSALVAQGGQRARKLDGKIATHGIDQAGIVPACLTGVLPSHDDER